MIVNEKGQQKQQEHASNIQQLVCGWLWRCVIVVVVVGKVLEAVSPLETSTAGSPDYYCTCM